MNKGCAGFLALLAIVTGCAQVLQMSAFSKCDFRIDSVDDIKLAHVPITGVESVSDLTWTQAGEIAGAFASGTLPLEFTLNLEVRNPNKKKAAMNRLEWILFVDERQMLTGSSDQRVEVEPESTTLMPVRVSMDLVKVLERETLPALITLALNVAGFSERPSVLKVKAKPSVVIGSKTLDYPGYITITHTYGGSQE